MKRRNVLLVFLREVRDQFRDRRTMFMMLVLPLLLYPGMGVGILQMTLIFNEQARKVVVLGLDELPAKPVLITEDGQFDARLFDDRPDATKYLNLYIEGQPPREDTNSPNTELSADEQRQLIAEAREILTLTQRKEKLLEAVDALEAVADVAYETEETTGKPNSQSPVTISPEEIELQQIERELAERFVKFNADLIVSIPENYNELIEEYVSQDRPTDPGQLYLKARPTLIYNSANERSQLAYSRTLKALTFWERELLKLREENLNLPSTFISPVFERELADGTRQNVTDVARDEQRAANIWSRFFPTLLILMTLTGAFYPSIDLGAGEKERGTMETLLISPAARSEIVLGKFFTILLFSLLTALINIASMGGSLFLFTLAGEAAMSRLGGIALPSLGTFAMLGVLMVPLASLFSALSLALATFARSTKEGQYYLTPMLLVVMGLTIVCMSPAVELTPFNSVIPVVGMGLMLKSLLLSSVSDVNVYVYLAPVMLTSLGYSLLALWWANEQFHKEEVLFREAERFELGLWFKHLMREKEPLPTTGEAVFCFVLIMLLQFLLAGVFSPMMHSSGDVSTGMLRALLIQQVVIIASPALFMGVLLTSDFKRTFRLKLPSLKYCALALVLPFLLQPLAVELQHSLSWFFPPVAKSVQDAMALTSDQGQSFWLLLAVFALAPAVCEELAFRGLILSGFSRRGRNGVAIVFSALLFGVMHMIPQQVFNAFLLGLVIGMLAIRSGSLWPGVIFHFVNNGLTVGLSRMQPEDFSSGWIVNWIDIRDNELRYTWLTIALCGICGTVLLGWLYRSPNENTAPAEEPT